MLERKRNISADMTYPGICLMFLDFLSNSILCWIESNNDDTNNSTRLLCTTQCFRFRRHDVWIDAGSATTHTEWMMTMSHQMLIQWNISLCLYFHSWKEYQNFSTHFSYVTNMWHMIVNENNNKRKCAYKKM